VGGPKFRSGGSRMNGWTAESESDVPPFAVPIVM
jgi:hypothetical protein